MNFIYYDVQVLFLYMHIEERLDGNTNSSYHLVVEKGEFYFLFYTSFYFPTFYNEYVYIL